MKNRKEIIESTILACQWLTDIAQVREKQIPPEQNSRGIVHPDWRGSIRGEYSAETRQWNTFCPMWHTGQAAKALVMAWRELRDDSLLDAAKLAGQFIQSNRISDPGNKDYGMLCCYEGEPGESNSSANLETLDGLFYLGDATGNRQYQNWAVDTLRWIQHNAYIRGSGHFKDFYYPENRKWLITEWTEKKGRPLLDDAMFLKGWEVTRDESFKQIALETAEALLDAEAPPGNWINYGPCMKARKMLHPRHAYWWGRPMLKIYKATGDERFLECFYRSVNWYAQAMRKDGGIIRGTYSDFNTDSFGHATSGAACAVLCFLDYYEHTRDPKILEYIELGMDYCMKMQLKNTRDPNLKGAILEKVLSPDGSDRNPLYIRDLGTIFYIQAACRHLEILKDSPVAEKTELAAETA